MVQSHTKKSKKNALFYTRDNSDFTINANVHNLGINLCTLHHGVLKAKDRGEVHRSPGNYEFDVVKKVYAFEENYGIQKNALEIPRKVINILGNGPKIFLMIV